MREAEERTLDSLRSSAIITRTFGIANPAFVTDEARLLALFERLYIYAGHSEDRERRLGGNPAPPAGRTIVARLGRVARPAGEDAPHEEDRCAARHRPLADLHAMMDVCLL